MEALGSELKVLFDFEYEAREKRKISITKGEKLFLLCKTNKDWWQVIKSSTERPFYVPVQYVMEVQSNVLHSESNVEKIDAALDLKLSHDNAESDKIKTYKGPILPCKHSRVKKMQPNYSHSSDENEFRILDDDLEATSDTDVNTTHSELGHLPDGEGVKSASETVYANIPCNPHTLPRGSEHKQCVEQCLVPHSLPVAPLKSLRLSFDSSNSFPNVQNKDEPCVKSKLSKSRSFKTRNELQKIAHPVDTESVLLTFRFPDVNQRKSFSTRLNSNQNDYSCDNREKVNVCENDKCNQASAVPLSFHNALYGISNVQDEVNKTSDSGNISSESLFNHEEDVSDSGASHKSGLGSSAQSRESIQEHSDVPGEDTSKDEFESSREDLWTADMIEDVPLPAGWRIDVDEVSGEQCYLNDATEAKWFSSTDGKGRVYYFEENSSVSSWTLPNIVVANEEEIATPNDQQNDGKHVPRRNQEGEKIHRELRTRSMCNNPSRKEMPSKSSSIRRDFLQHCGLDKDVLLHGNMNRTKITENGKKMSKKWASAFVVLTQDTLCFYKDLKNSHHSHSMGLQAELSIQLSGARVESGEKLSSRKHVFLVSSNSLQLLCECENANMAMQWRQTINNAITKLNLAVLTSPGKTPPEKPKASIGRSKSLHVKTHDLGIDDAACTDEQQMKIRDRLKKFFNRRPTKEVLANKGIYKDEPVFDSHLEKVCPAQPPFIPDFVRLCVCAIESNEENMKTDGLYRASGNLSHVQKIRLQVDQNNLTVLETEEDVHVLTGALKLFFRELKEPLIPYDLFNKAIDAGGRTGNKEKIKIFREIAKQLPLPNHDTLKFLLKHLRNVTAYQEFNRMQIPNLAIVFGPTLMWREKAFNHNIAIEYMQQNIVIEFFLREFDDIFR